MMILRNFTIYATTSNVAITGASAITTLPTPTKVSGGPPVSPGTSVLLQNFGTVNIFFKFTSASAGTASATSALLQPGCAMVFDIGAGDPYAIPFDGTMRPITGIALFCSSGTGSINICMGVGS